MLSTRNLKKNPFEFMCSVKPRVRIGNKVRRKEFSPRLTLDLKKARKVLKRFKVEMPEAPPEVGEDKATRWKILKTFELAVQASLGYVFGAKTEDYKPGFSPSEVVSAAVGMSAEDLVTEQQAALAAGAVGSVGTMVVQSLFGATGGGFLSCEPIAEEPESDYSNMPIPEEFTGSVDKWLEIYQKKAEEGVKYGKALRKILRETYSTPPLLIDATEMNDAEELKEINQGFTKTNVVIVRYKYVGRNYRFSVLYNVAYVVPLSALWFLLMDMPGFEKMAQELLDRHNMTYRKLKSRGETFSAEANLFSKTPSNIKFSGKYEVPKDVKDRAQLENLVINSPEGVIKGFPDNLKEELTQNLIEEFAEGMAHEIIESYAIGVKEVKKEGAGGPSHQVTAAFLEHYSFYGFFDWLAKGKKINEWSKEYGNKIRPFEDIIAEYKNDPWQTLDEYVCRHLDDYFPTRRCR